MAIENGGTVEPGNAPASTGIRGLDEILRGGFPRDEMHLAQGGSGTGKTTLGLHYLLAGRGAGESGLYITLSQSKRGLERIAASHGWSLEGLTVYEVTPGSLLEEDAAEQTVLHTSEVELGELTRTLRRIIGQMKPRRIVLDSIGVLGLLAGNRQRFHREVVGLRQFVAGQGCTALFIGDGPAEVETEGTSNTELHAVASSLIHMDQTAPEYGEVRRRVRIIKVRGVPFDGGYHNFRIRTGGLEVYPRLGRYAAPEYTDFRRIQSGVEPLDELLGGGLELGTACLVIGPSGAGKSTVATLFCRAAAAADDSAAIFLFEERPETFKTRSRAVGIDLGPHLQSGRITLRELQPAEISPGEFAQHVRSAVEEGGAKVVLIDSLTGYFNVMGDTPMLLVQMHELLNFLSRRGVLTLLVVSQEGFLSAAPQVAPDVSYLSDTILLLRMFEADGAIHRCIAAGKKRQGEHETTIRELCIRPGEVDIGRESLRQFRSILSGDAILIARNERRREERRASEEKEADDA